MSVLDKGSGNIDPEIQDSHKFRDHKQITCNTNNLLILLFSGNLVIVKVVDNFLSFKESTRTLNSELVYDIYD
jgi:hypothetical protein